MSIGALGLTKRLINMNSRYILATSLLMLFTTPVLAYNNTSLKVLNNHCNEWLFSDQENQIQLGIEGESSLLKNPHDFSATTCVLGFCLDKDGDNPNPLGNGDGGRPPLGEKIGGNS
jgi:hypothetical protein